MDDDFLEETKRAEDRQAELTRRAAEVEARKGRLQNNLEKSDKNRTRTYTAFVVTGIILAAAFLYIFFNSSIADSALILLFAVAVYGVVSIWAVSLFRSRARRVKEELQEIRFEEELLRSGASAEESRAEELLRMHQYQLRRYYDLNLTQNSWIFAVGILCILLGVAVIATTFLIIVHSSGPWQIKAIVGLVGAIGSLMTNYIAAVYLRMNSAITGSLTTFHLTLASTHQLFLANLLVSRIAEPEERWKALARLSLAITQHDAGKISKAEQLKSGARGNKKKKTKEYDDNGAEEDMEPAEDEPPVL
jgi:ABC-type multidrug transport system fused ATPase/permease subunit